MGQFLGFADLIEEKIRKQMRVSSSETSNQTQEIKIKWGQDYEAMPRHQFNFQEKIWRPKGENTPYKVKAKELPNYEFNNQQQVAVSFFNTQGVALSQRFSLHELKRAYRKAAIKHHPDQGGTTQAFQLLQIHFKILKDFLTPKNAA